MRGRAPTRRPPRAAPSARIRRSPRRPRRTARDRRHVPEIPVVRSHAPAHGEQERGVGVVARPVEVVQQRRADGRAVEVRAVAPRATRGVERSAILDAGGPAERLPWGRSPAPSRRRRRARRRRPRGAATVARRALIAPSSLSVPRTISRGMITPQDGERSMTASVAPWRARSGRRVRSPLRPRQTCSRRKQPTRWSFTIPVACMKA